MITINLQPQTIQPSYSNLVYQFSSTAQTAYYKYRYIVDIYVGGQNVSRQKITPQNTNWGQVDVSPIIKNYFNSRPINKGCTGTTETPIVQAQWGGLEDDMDNIFIAVGEEYSLTPDGNVEIYAPNDISNTTYIYNGVKNWNQGKSFYIQDYYLSNLDVPQSFPADSHKFMTYAPRVQYIGDDDWATLAGINMWLPTILTGDTSTTYSAPVYSALFEFYDIDGNNIQSSRTYNILENCGRNPDCTTVTGNTANEDNHLMEYLGTGTKNLTEHGINLPANWHYYRVSFESTSYRCFSYLVTNNNEFGSVPVTYYDCGSGVIDTINITGGNSANFCSRKGWTFPTDPNTVVTQGGECTYWDGEEPCFSTSRISEHFYYYKDPECGPGNRRVMFLNSFGTWDYFTFKYRDTTGYDVARETLQTEPTLYTSGWDADKYYGWNNTNKVWNQRISKTGLLYSGRISKSYLAWLTDELLKSPSVYFVDSDGDIQPIVLTNTEVIEPNFQRNDGQYEMELEYRGGYNEIRQDNE